MDDGGELDGERRRWTYGDGESPPERNGPKRKKVRSGPFLTRRVIGDGDGGTEPHKASAQPFASDKHSMSAAHVYGRQA